MSNFGSYHANQPGAANQPGTAPGLFHTLVPVRAWMRTPALLSWPALLFVALVTVPPIGLVILGPNPTMASFSDASWLFAAYFAVAWLLLIGVIVRPALVTRRLLFVVVVLALVTEVPLAVALETALHATNANLLSSIFTIGLPEELAKAIPVLVIAAFFRRRLAPVDYLFLGAVSGLVFGASEVEHYITSVVTSSTSGGITPGDAGVLVLAYVWRFLTDPISHACWAGLTGYFIGLAVSGTHQWYRVAWVGLAMAMVLHGLNDWDVINGRVTWVLVVAVSGVLFLAYAKGPAHPGLHAYGASAPPAYGSPAPGASAPPGVGAPPPARAPAPGVAWYALPPADPAAPSAPAHPSAPPQHRPSPSAPTVPAGRGQPSSAAPPGQGHGQGPWWHPSQPADSQPTQIRSPAATVPPPPPRPKPWWEE
jgi:RsiW-degrading membrane proteinase PrsW (M82 family)